MLWDSNVIQFARLLCEIVAVWDEGDCKHVIRQVAESMDLTFDEVNILFDRAEKEWEDAKKRLDLPDVICANCGSNNVEYAAWYNPNTKEVGECFGDWKEEDSKFCNDCEERELLAYENDDPKFREMWEGFKKLFEEPPEPTPMPKFVQELVSTFPGLLDDDHVSGSDVVDWLTSKLAPYRPKKKDSDE